MTIRDGNWELFSHDPHTGKTVWRYFDGMATHYRTDMPVDNIISDNRAAQADLAGKAQQDGVGDLVARIPLNVAFQQLGDAMHDQAYLSRWLNDSDNAAWRVKEGRL